MKIAPPPPPAPVPLSAGHALLDPGALSRLTEKAVREVTRQGQSANTQASYAGAMRYWAAWYGARYGQALHLPVPIPVVVQFIVDHAQRRAEDGVEAGPVKTTRKRVHRAAGGPAAPQQELVHDLPPVIDQQLVAQRYKGKLGPLALNTLVHRIAVLSKAHQVVPDMDNPCNHPGVRDLLKNVRRGYADRGVRAHKQSALTREPLEAVLATCDESPRGKRDRALLLFAWASGGRRRSEVTTATMENLHNHGARGFVYVLGRSKANQEAKDDESNHKPVSGKAAQALREWLALSGISEGPIFRRLRKGGKVTADALDPEAVRKIVQRRCALAGLPGQFSAHSLRSGFVTEAGSQDIPAIKAMLLTGHKKAETFMGYYRAGNVLKNEAGRLLDDEDD
ncbi:site-specific integrase [Variovorax sp. JS1663]|uniref:site-specific integrase n=1 Tax=Variovorax sp. JS1663 TaxID=1851577 RepID=UPI000B349134|nr:site-specific integrase [Variovorax sp. JS1663]OUM00104.1 hypothetical protein A8M77_23265 [Variovorax sp. JS1663]